MKARLIGSVCSGLVLLSSVSFAQEDFSGRWRPDERTLISDAWASPFAAAAPPVVITQTTDALSWEAADGRQQTIRLNEPSVVSGRTYTARWVDRALQLEARYTLPDGRTVTLLQVLLRNANDELEIVSFFPLPRSNQGTEISRLIYYRRK
jgi:hypothetical protein